jgi:hypothetical protein
MMGRCVARYLYAAVGCSLLVATAPDASADPFADHPQSHTFVSLGAIGDVGGHFADSAPGTGVVTAGGFELSATHWLGHVGDVLEDSKVAVGGFAQIEAANPDGHARGAAGFQASYMFIGSELGASLEQGRGPYATSAGVHFAPFVSLGVLYLALRAEMPVAAMSSGGTLYGFGLAFVVGLKAPIPLDGGTILDSSTFH